MNVIEVKETFLWTDGRTGVPRILTLGHNTVPKAYWAGFLTFVSRDFEVGSK